MARYRGGVGRFKYAKKGSADHLEDANNTISSDEANLFGPESGVLSSNKNTQGFNKGSEEGGNNQTYNPSKNNPLLNLVNDGQHTLTAMDQETHEGYIQRKQFYSKAFELAIKNAKTISEKRLLEKSRDEFNTIYADELDNGNVAGENMRDVWDHLISIGKQAERKSNTFASVSEKLGHPDSISDEEWDEWKVDEFKSPYGNKTGSSPNKYQGTRSESPKTTEEAKPETNESISGGDSKAIETIDEPHTDEPAIGDTPEPFNPSTPEDVGADQYDPVNYPELTGDTNSIEAIQEIIDKNANESLANQHKNTTLSNEALLDADVAFDNIQKLIYGDPETGDPGLINALRDDRYLDQQKKTFQRFQETNASLWEDIAKFEGVNNLQEASLTRFGQIGQEADSGPDRGLVDLYSQTGKEDIDAREAAALRKINEAIARESITGVRAEKLRNNVKERFDGERRKNRFDATMQAHSHQANAYGQKAQAERDYLNATTQYMGGLEATSAAKVRSMTGDLQEMGTRNQLRGDQIKANYLGPMTAIYGMEYQPLIQKSSLLKNFANMDENSASQWIGMNKQVLDDIEAKELFEKWQDGQIDFETWKMEMMSKANQPGVLDYGLGLANLATTGAGAYDALKGIGLLGGGTTYTGGLMSAMGSMWPVAAGIGAVGVLNNNPKLNPFSGGLKL